MIPARRIHAVGGVPVLRGEVLRDPQREAFLPLRHEAAVDDEQPARPHEAVLAEELVREPEESHPVVFVGRNEWRAAPLGAGGGGGEVRAVGRGRRRGRADRRAPSRRSHASSRRDDVPEE